MGALRAIVPAAGKGRRLQAVSGDLPKAMYCVGGRPLLEICLDNINFIHDDDIYIVVGHARERIIEYFAERFHYVEQARQLGTGHAVMECADAFAGFEGDVLVTFGDMPLFRRSEMLKMCEHHASSKADCTLMTAENPELPLWARIVRDDQNRFAAIVEGRDCTPEQTQIKELFSGVMVFNSRSLFQMLPLVGCANIQKEYYLTEVPELMAKHGMKVETYFTPDGSDLRGVNTPEDLEICERLLKERA